MLCKELPADPQDLDLPNLTSQIRAVGTVVRATCDNKTVAILECLPNLLWNGTLPSCKESDSYGNVNSILIIVWVIGGILLFTLIILISIIIGSRSKTVRRVNGQQPTTVFHISGQQEGGDNPAFSRSEERCGSSTRLTSPDPNSRLPSYQEAIRGLYGRPPPTAPALSEPYFNRANAPPSYRSSHQYRTTTVHTSSSQTTASAISTTENEEAGTRRGSTQSSASARPSATTTTNTNEAATLETRRYAERYPQCLWEEDPPPPYTPGPSNLHLYRSPVRTSQSRPAQRRSLTSRSRSAQSTAIPMNESQPNPAAGGRTPASSNYVNDTQIMSTVASTSEDHPHISYSAPSSSTNDASGHYATTIQVTNDRFGSQRHTNPMPLPAIQPTNQHTTLHSMLPLSNSQVLGPPLSSSTPLPSPAPARRNDFMTASMRHYVPATSSSLENRQHCRSQSHGSDTRTTNQHIPSHHRPLPLPRTQQVHDRQPSAPIARLEVEYF